MEIKQIELSLTNLNITKKKLETQLEKKENEKIKLDWELQELEPDDSSSDEYDDEY